MGGYKRIHNQSFNLKGYVIDRCVRIYLPLIASILLYLLTCILLHQPFDVVCAIGNLLNLQESFVEPLVGPYWSLAYEMWFYISVAAFYLILRNEKGKWWGLLLMGMIGVVFVNGLDFFYFFLWLMGAFAFLTLPQKGNKLVMIVSAVVMVISIALTQILSDSHSVSIVIPFISNYKMAELLLASTMCVFIQQIVLFPPRRKFWQFVEDKIGGLAKFSYTLYLSHRIVFLLLFATLYTQGIGQFKTKDLIIYLSFLVLSIVLCWLFYLITERYTSSVKHYFKIKFNVV